MLVLAARAHLARGEHQPAYDLLERALAANPRSSDALYFMGIVSSELATQAFGRVYALAPDGARAHQLMGRALRLQERRSEAAVEYERALAANPTLVDALLEFAFLRREESNCEEAAALYERAQRVKVTYETAYGLGVCRAMLNDHARAIAAFREALTHDPESAAAQFGLGSSLLQLGDAAGAVVALERAQRLAPDSRQTCYLLGRAYQKMGRLDLAQEAFARADALARAEQAGQRPVKPPR